MKIEIANVYKAVDDKWYIWIVERRRWMGKSNFITPDPFVETSFNSRREAIQTLKKFYNCKKYKIPTAVLIETRFFKISKK